MLFEVLLSTVTIVLPVEVVEPQESEDYINNIIGDDTLDV
jgi:hypothetical protein